MEFSELLGAASGQALAIFIVLFILWFLSARAWPWVTESYVPGRRAHEELMIEASARIADAIEAQAMVLERLLVAATDNLSSG